MTSKYLFLGSAALIGSLVVAGHAQALPYADASNQITNLTINNVTIPGGVQSRITPSTFSETISATAAFGGSASSTDTQGATSTTNPLNLAIPQAFSGTVAPGSAVFTPLGAGSFTGTRANANIGAANTTTGAVSVNNVAEGSGNATSFGASNANNKATLGFTIAGTGQGVLLQFTDTYQLKTTTTQAGETANASLQNTFSVTDLTTGLTVASFAPAELNQTIGAANVGGSAVVAPTTTNYSFTTPVLTQGHSFSIQFTSGASENIFPPAAVPEPLSMSLLGIGLIGLGAVRRFRRA